MKHLNVKRIWAVIVTIIMVLQLLPAAAIAETVEDETAAVETVTEAVEPEEPAEPAVEPEEPAEPAVEPEEPAEPAVEPEEPAEPAVEPEEPAEPIVEPEEPAEPVVEPEEPAEPVVEPEEPAEPVVEPEEPAEPVVEPEEPVEASSPFSVEWNDFTITVEDLPEDADVRVREAHKYLEALQRLTGEETVETLFALSLSRKNVKLDKKATVTVSGKALNDLPEGATLAEINKHNDASAVDFEYTEQDAETGEPASITFRTSVLDIFALILPGAAEETKPLDIEKNTDPIEQEKVLSQENDAEAQDDGEDPEQVPDEPLRASEPYVATKIQKTWGQEHIYAGHGLEYDWSIGWNTKESFRDVEYDSQGRLILHPHTWVNLEGKIGIEIAVRKLGEGNSEEAVIPAGAVEIVIPRYIFYAWDDDDVNQNTFMELNLSMDGVPVGKNSFQNISAEQSGSINYYYEYVGDTIVIRNWNAIASGTFTTEIGYTVDPLKVNGGHPRNNSVDYSRNETCFWLNYVDYYQNEFPITFRMDANLDGENEVDYTGKLGIAVKTRIASTYRAMPMPVGKIELTANNNELKSGVFFGWDNVWGEKPDGADDYFYIVWNVTYARGQHKLYPASNSLYPNNITYLHGNTRRYHNYTQGWEAMIGAENADNYIEVDGQRFQGEVLGIRHWASMANYSLPYATDHTYVLYNTSLAGLAKPADKNLNNGYFRAVRYDGSITGSGYTNVDVNGKDNLNNGNFYAILIAYPKEAIQAVGYEKMISDGLNVDAMFRITETWDSGYVSQDTVKTSTRFTLDPVGGSGIFSKTVGHTAYANAGGGQTFLLNGEEVDLNKAASSGGSYTASWSNVLASNSPTIGTTVLGQHMVMTDTWKDGTLFIASSKASNVNLFSASDTEDLTEDDYQFNGFWFSSVKEFDADCLEMPDEHGNMTYVWSVHDPDKNYTAQKPVLVYIRLRGQTDFIPYCAVYRTTAADKSEAYLWNGEIDSETGLPVKGAKLAWAWGHYPVPEGTVQIRVEHDSDFYRCEIRFNVGVRILPTDHVKEIVQRHVDNNANSLIRNVTTYSTAPLHTTGMSDEGVASLTRSGSNYRANGSASNDTFTLTRLTNSLSVFKNYYTPADTDSYQQAATHEDKQISYIQLCADNNTNLINAVALTTDHEDPYKLLKGTFYELLPKGTNVQEGSIFGYFDMDYWRGANSGQESKASNYRLLKSKKGSNWGARYWFKDGDFSCRTYPVTLENGTEQTMLQIDYAIEDPHINNNYSESNSWWSRVYFYFIMENNVDNIELNGEYTVNPIGFVNRTEGGVAKTGSGYSLEDAQFGEQESPFTEISEQNEQSAFSKTTIVWNAVVTTETGFSKAVAKYDETLNSVAESVLYKPRETVAVGNDYMYRLRYRTESGTRSKDIIFFDILESGTTLRTSADWRGDLVAVNTKEIEKKVSVTSTTGAKCAPVVYYSTTITEVNNSTGSYYDLTDGNKWSKTPPSDLSKVTAIAVDCSIAKNNKGEEEPFVIGPDDTLYVFIHMKAPRTYTEGEVVNGAVISARPYSESIDPNHNSSMRDPSNPELKKLWHEASVLLYDVNAELKKESDPMTGTPEARTMVKADGSGTITYRLTVRNDMPFDLNDVVVSDPIPEGLTIDRVTVKLNGASTETDASATEGFTYEQNGQTCTFTIAKQYPTVVENGAVTTNKDTEIYIYTTVDELKNADGSQVLLRDYDNTATLVSANGKELNQDTDTMYHRAETVKIPVEKIWDDDGDRDGLRPTTINVTLTGKVGEDTVVTETATLNEQNSWKDNFEHLPKYDIDDSATDFDVPTTYTEIVYTISEQQVENYEEPVIDNENYTITNKHVPATTEISANKKWKNADGTVVPPAGAKVTYTLYADGQPTEYTVELKGEVGTEPTAMGGYESEEWTAKFVNLPKNRDHGTPIVYTVKETVTYGGYAPDKTEPVADGVTITNEQETTEISAKKKWENADGTLTPPRGAKVTFTLYANGTPTEYSVELKGEAGTKPTVTGGYESKAWTASFVNLPKYTPGTTTEIVYTVAETVTYDGYGLVASRPVADGGTITNKQLTTEISAKKAWKNADGSATPPEGATVTYTLYADGAPMKYTVELKGEAGTKPAFTDGYESEPWTASFVNLPKYKPGTTTEIEYTVAETVTYDGYTPSTADPVADGETITNEQETTEISAKKAWKNVDGTTTPPEGATVTYTLYADGTATEYTVELKGVAGEKPDVTGGYESEPWTASFVNLPKYTPGTTTEIVYTVAETVTYAGYTPSTTDPVADGETITNEQEATEATIVKVWDDDDDRDGKRPDSLTVVLSNGTEVVLNEENNWTAKVENLPKIDSATGEEIEYTWTEKDLPEGYTLTDTSKDGTVSTLTNTHEPETIEIPVEKIWDDADDRDGKRPGSITVNLLADGEKVGSATITEKDGWKYTFKDLPKYQDHGKEIKYTIEEEEVDLYTTTIDGFKITNKYVNNNPRIIISGQKTWDDKNNYEGKRPSSITIRLYADGVEVQAATVTAADGWHYAFADLPKFQEDGKTEIKYTISEDEVYGYVTKIDGFNVINTFTVQTGDNAHPGLWITILSLSVLAGAAMLILERKSRKNRKQNG